MAAFFVLLATACSGGTHLVATPSTSAVGATSPPVSHADRRDGLILFTRHFPNPDQKAVPGAAWTPRAALYSVRPTGADVRRLTSLSGGINEIAGSPDGNAIAYDAETYVYGKDPHVTGDFVHVMDVDGADNRTVYSCPASDCSSLQWSPSGGRLLMNGDAVLQPDGRVTRLCQGGCRHGYPMSEGSWSPDGRQLVFQDSVAVKQRDGTSTVPAIGTADADGRHIELITNRQCATAAPSACTYDSSPEWSPNGQRIAFVRLRSRFLPLDGSTGLGPIGPTGVYTVRPDGTDITKISTCGTRCRVAAVQWASDGKRLAYVGSPYEFRDNTATSAIDIADATTGSVGALRLRTRTSQPNEQWIEPVIAWAPNGHELALVAHEPDKPTALYTLRVRHNMMNAPVSVRGGAYPPIVWLPRPGGRIVRP
jgi:dipeptidyl aminopeptidase/acylaminoacyl peptidase